MKALRKVVGAGLRTVPPLRRWVFPSTDYAVITREEALQHQGGGWLRPLTARRQLRAYESLLRKLREGEIREDFRVAVEAIKATGIERPMILDVGCGSGVYSEVFSSLLDGPFDYLGIDFSPAMIRLARRRYPDGRFLVGDAYGLGLATGAVDVVFDGVALMHLICFEAAIAESSRVARSYCVFHSVPVSLDGATTYLSKYAYGSRVTEVAFGRDELLACFRTHGLTLSQSWKSIPYDVYPVTPFHTYCETFLLRTDPK